MIHESFADRPPLDPPATALDETVESVGEALDAHGGLLVEHEGDPVGALLLEPRGRLLGLRRVGVLDERPWARRRRQDGDRAEEIAAARKFGGSRSRRGSSCRRPSSSGAGSGTSSPAATATA